MTAAKVVLLAAAVRLLYLFSFHRSDLYGFFVADQSYYRDWALSLSSGGWVSPGAFEQGPLYAYLLGLVYRLFGPRDIVALAVQLLAGVGTVLLVHACTRRVFGRRAALVAALLAAVNGPLIFHEGLLMKTWLEPLLAMAALWAALRYVEASRPRWLLAATVCVGLLALVREIHLLLLAPVALAAWRCGRLNGLSRKHRALHLASAGLACALVLAPSALRNCRRAGECVPVTTSGGEVAYLAWGPWAGAYYTPPPFIRPWSRLEHQDFRDEASLRAGERLTREESSAFWLREAFREIRAAPARTVLLMWQKAQGLLNDYEFPDSENYAVSRRLIPVLAWLPTFGWIVGAGVLGGLAALRAPARAFLPLCFLAALALEVLATYTFGRFRLVFVPILLLFAGHAVDLLATSAASRTSRGILRGIGGICVIVLTTVLAYRVPPVRGGEGWIRQVDGDFLSEVTVRAQERLVVTGIERHLAEHPGDAEAWAALGDESEALGRLFEARNAHLTAVLVDPRRAASHWSLANLFYRQGRLDLAAEQGRVFVQSTPGSSQGHLGLAVFCSRIALESRDQAVVKRLREEAEKHFTEGTRLDPGNAAIYSYRGTFAALFGDWGEAAGYLSRALEIDPGFFEALHVLSMIRPHLSPGAAPAGVF